MGIIHLFCAFVKSLLLRGLFFVRFRCFFPHFYGEKQLMVFGF